MARFDEEFAKLTAQLQAALSVIAQHPDVAAEVKTAIDAVDLPAVVTDGEAQDEARANVITNLLDDFGSALEPTP
jgi:hypothetical protein